MTARWDKLPVGARPARAPRRRAQRSNYYCLGVGGCGALLEAFTSREADEHADTHGGARLELVPPEDRAAS